MWGVHFIFFHGVHYVGGKFWGGGGLFSGIGHTLEWGYTLYSGSGPQGA